MKNDQHRVLPEHIALLKAAQVDWVDCEFGAPAIDCKRPYGNSSVHEDIVEVLHDAGLWPTAPADSELSEDDRERLALFHKGTERALQIFLQVGAMEPGLYESPAYRNRWTRIGD